MTDGEGPRPSRLGVLYSGGGRTLENLAREVESGSIPADIALSISSHAGAGGIALAEKAGVPNVVLDYRKHGDDLCARICEELEKADVDWIILAGFIRFFRFAEERHAERWKDRVLNIHPALLPAFGGKGYYGSRVHEAVIASGARVSGCTVHFVDDKYDQGPILLQRIVPVQPDDDASSLAARVFEEECVAYPEAIRLCLSGRVKIEDGRALIAGA